MLDTQAGERLRRALELSALAENEMLLRFQAENPEATEEEIEDRLLRWMAGAEYEEPRRQLA